jgi:hypothetical protein
VSGFDPTQFGILVGQLTAQYRSTYAWLAVMHWNKAGNLGRFRKSEKHPAPCAGHGKYVIEDTPAAYMNHSCDPNYSDRVAGYYALDICDMQALSNGWRDIVLSTRREN